MPQVTLSFGRTLQCEATLGLLRRIKRVHNVDLLGADSKAFSDFLSSSAVCWPVVCEFFNVRDIEDQEQLAEQAIGSDVAALIRGATEALHDFFQSCGEPDKAAALTKSLKTIQSARTALAQKISETDLENQVAKEMLSLNLMPEIPGN